MFYRLFRGFIRHTVRAPTTVAYNVATFLVPVRPSMQSQNYLQQEKRNLTSDGAVGPGCLKNVSGCHSPPVTGVPKGKEPRGRSRRCCPTKRRSTETCNSASNRERWARPSTASPSCIELGGGERWRQRANGCERSHLLRADQEAKRLKDEEDRKTIRRTVREIERQKKKDLQEKLQNRETVRQMMAVRSVQQAGARNSSLHGAPEHSPQSREGHLLPGDTVLPPFGDGGDSSILSQLGKSRGASESSSERGGREEGRSSLARREHSPRKAGRSTARC